MEQRSQIPVGPPVKDPLPSYWHEPKSPLANVIEPETEKPNQTYEYAIIGSGISGTMIAYNLLRSSPASRIVMIEAREICGGATGRNGGHTKAASYRSYLQHVKELGKEEALKIARLEYANIVETHRMAQDLGIECESKMCNTVDIFYDQTTFDLGVTAISTLRADATPEEKEDGQMAFYKIHPNTPETRQKFHITASNTNPTVQAEEKVAGVFEYLAGRIHAYRFTTSILEHCVTKGLVLCTNSPVHSIQPSSTSSTWSVHTQYSTLTSKHVILATNGYTPYLHPALQTLIVPMRGQITAQRPGKGNLLPKVLGTTYSFIYREGYEYMIPRPVGNGNGQHIVIGGGLGRLEGGGEGEYGTVDDSRLNKDISGYLKGSLRGYFGAETWGEDNDEERVVQEWTGIMGATPDGRPFVGEVPGNKGLWISAGFNGHGMVLCLKSAEALVDMITGKGVPEWFPVSYGISEERMRRGRGTFGGRTDMQVPA